MNCLCLQWHHHHHVCITVWRERIWTAHLEVPFVCTSLWLHLWALGHHSAKTSKPSVCVVSVLFMCVHFSDCVVIHWAWSQKHIFIIYTRIRGPVISSNIVVKSSCDGSHWSWCLLRWSCSRCRIGVDVFFDDLAELLQVSHQSWCLLRWSCRAIEGIGSVWPALHLFFC